MDCSCGIPNLNPFQALGSRRSLCFTCKVMALPFTFWTLDTKVSVAGAPKPSVMVSGSASTIWDASNSALISLSRTRAQPGVQMHVRVESSVKMLESLHRKELDLAVFFSRRETSARTPEIRVGSIPMVWVFQEARRSASAWNLVLFEPPCVFREAAIATLRDRPWKQTFSSPSLAGTWAAVSAGLGVSVRTPIGIPSCLQMRRQFPGLKKLPNVEIVVAQASGSPTPLVGRLREVLVQSLRTQLGAYAAADA